MSGGCISTWLRMPKTLRNDKSAKPQEREQV